MPWSPIGTTRSCRWGPIPSASVWTRCCRRPRRDRRPRHHPGRHQQLSRPDLRPGLHVRGGGAIREHGTGTTGSRIANGTYGVHRELEADLAHFFNRRSAHGVHDRLSGQSRHHRRSRGREGLILMDANSHASIYDGCRLSGATVVRFQHNDAADLDRRLRRLEGRVTTSSSSSKASTACSATAPRLPSSRRSSAGTALSCWSTRPTPWACSATTAAALPRNRGSRRTSTSSSAPSARAWGPSAASAPRTIRSSMCCALQPAVHVHGLVLPSSVASVLTGPRRMRNARSCARALWANARTLYEGLRAAGFDSARPEPDHRRPPAGRGERGPGLARAARAGRLRQPGAAAGHAERRVPAPLQRVRGAQPGRRSTRSARAFAGSRPTRRSGPAGMVRTAHA